MRQAWVAARARHARDPSTSELGRRLRSFLLGSYLLVLAVTGACLNPAPEWEAQVLAYQLVVYLTYAVIYLLPAALLTFAAHASARWSTRSRGPSRWREAAVWSVAVTTTTATVLLLCADRHVYVLYGFHLNGFVWNLATTPGGLESLGSSASTLRSVAGMAAGVLALELLLAWLTGQRLPGVRARLGPAGRGGRVLVGLFLLLSLGERVAYGISEVRAFTPILSAADAFPFYTRLTFRSLAGRLGFDVARSSGLEFDLERGNLQYPLRPLRVQRPARPLNVVWLVAESLRADALCPEIMPATSAFAARALRAPQHYSGGNGTRMGLFSMFYGLHGAYWFSFLRARRGPVLIDALAQQGYDLDLYTSARFTYPEFDKTIFAAVGAGDLHEYAQGLEWERDRVNVTRMLASIDERDTSRPFFRFLFFESPHAPYHFPSESALRTPYLEDFNYATMDLERDIELIRNRYLNACHHLDTQWGRVLAYLEQAGLLANTLVVLTGDHGEEFLEQGRWGHNSEFVEEQVRVPLVLWLPGEPARELAGMTSHVDLVATLLPRLGVLSPPEDYTLGLDLLGDRRRPFQAVSDWSRIAFVDSEVKMSFALKGAGLLRSRATSHADVPLDAGAVLAGKRDQLFGLLGELARFRGVPRGPARP